MIHIGPLISKFLISLCTTPIARLQRRVTRPALLHLSGQPPHREHAGATPRAATVAAITEAVSDTL